jgi:ParB/RepB/Spo0J family partition protein
MIPVDNILTGLNNRTDFDQESLQEVAETMKIHGVLQNLTVRKAADGVHFDLVIGERRLRAAKIAGLTEVPCIIRELNDDELREVMLIENIQRKDIHALDEAATFALLQDRLKDFNRIALKTGKSTRYVRERLALNNLSEKAKELFRGNTMQLGHALILCLFKKDHQEKAIQYTLQKEEGFLYFNHPQDLKEWIQCNVMLSLSKAIFNVDDSELVTKAGACSSCTKQTGANAELFATVTADAQCLDKKCFLHKTEVFINMANKAMLKQFNLKREDCQEISNNQWAYKGLAYGKWHKADAADECPTVTVGFLEIHDGPPRATMICTNKKCAVHFAQEVKASAGKSTVTEDEKPSETIARRMENRRRKELIEDHHIARRAFMEKVGAVKQTLNDFELIYLARIMAGRGAGNAREVAAEIGVPLKQDESHYSYDWMDELIKYLTEQGKPAMMTFLRKVILRENLSEGSKSIVHSDPKEDELLIHGKSFDIDFKPFLTEAKDARKETYAGQNAELKLQRKKEKVQDEKVDQLIANAAEEYPLLHSVMKAKGNARTTLLQAQQADELSRMAYRLGLKRKKNETVEYYAKLIGDALREKLKSKKE